MRLPDYSIIFLKPTLEEVYDALDDTPIATIFKRNFICLAPDEFYTQRTNYEQGINLGADAKVELVTCCDKVLLDITDKTTIYQWSHQVTGKSQMTYEIVNISKTFSQPVHLKFTQLTNPDNVFYSNSFEVSNNYTETTRVDYQGQGIDVGGVDWATNPKESSIRIRAYFTKLIPKTAIDNYLQTSGTTITLYPTPSLAHGFEVCYQDNWGLLAFEYIRYLCNYAVFLTKGNRKYGLRATRIDTASEDVLGSTNFFKASFEAYINDRDIHYPKYQITPDFAPTLLSPLGIYLPTSFPSQFSGTFNKPIVLGTGTLTVHNDDGSTFATFAQAEIIVIGNSFTIDISGLSFTNGKYFNTFTSGLFNSVDGQTYEIAYDDEVQWAYEIMDGRYDPTRYQSSRYI